MSIASAIITFIQEARPRTIALGILAMAALGSAIALWVLYGKSFAKMGSLNEKMQQLTQSQAHFDFMKWKQPHSWGHYDNWARITYGEIPQVQADIRMVQIQNLAYLGGASGATLLTFLLALVTARHPPTSAASV